MAGTTILITGANGEIGHGLISHLADTDGVSIVALGLHPLDDVISARCHVKIVGEILDKGNGVGMSIDLSRRQTYALPTWHSRLESSRLTSGFPSWRGNLRNISVL